MLSSPPSATFSKVTIFAGVAVLCVVLAPQALFAQPPVPTISISEPADETEFENGGQFQASGTCSLPNTAFKVKVTNIYGSTTNTHEYEGTTNAEGEWQDNVAMNVYGMGTWKVEVWLVGNAQVNDSHEGDVSAPPE